MLVRPNIDGGNGLGLMAECDDISTGKYHVFKFLYVSWLAGDQTGGSCTLTTAERPPCTTASASLSTWGSSPGSDTVTPYAPPAARATPGRSASGSKLAWKSSALAAAPSGWTRSVENLGAAQPRLS